MSSLILIFTPTVLLVMKVTIIVTRCYPFSFSKRIIFPRAAQVKYKKDAILCIKIWPDVWMSHLYHSLHPPQVVQFQITASKDHRGDFLMFLHSGLSTTIPSKCQGVSQQEQQNMVPCHGKVTFGDLACSGLYCYRNKSWAQENFFFLWILLLPRYVIQSPCLQYPYGTQLSG